MTDVPDEILKITMSDLVPELQLYVCACEFCCHIKNPTIRKYYCGITGDYIHKKESKSIFCPLPNF